MDRKINFFDKIGSLIPGYEGYQERDGRRNADKILREKIFDLLSNSQIELIKFMEEFVEQKDFISLKRIEKIRKNVDTIQSKIKFLSYGESSFFSETQIKENELSEIYDLDLKLLDHTESLVQNISNKKIETTEKLLDNLRISLIKREEFLSSFR